jgi:transcriptional regulator with XRE-family HTH domain
MLIKRRKAMVDNSGTPPINVDYFEDLTGTIDSDRSESPGSASGEHIGRRIQKIREQKGISLTDLSHLTGFDKDLLQEIEKGDVSPQLGMVIKLSKALDSALERLISDEGQKLYTVTRHEERKIVSRTTTSRGRRSAYTYMSLAAEVKGRHMEALMVELEEMTDSERSVHAGEEFIYVVDGVVALHIGEEHFELREGDSAYYLSTTEHLVSAKGGKAKILAVIYSQ